MRVLPFLLIALSLTGSLLAQPDAKKDPAAKADLDKRSDFDGTWILVSLEIDGKKITPKKETRSIITGSKFVVIAGDEVIAAGTTKLDPTKTPKAIDTTYTEGANKGKVFKGIYEVEGNVSKFCRAGSPEDKRPTEFKTSAEKGGLYSVYKRAKVVPTLSKQERDAIVEAATQAIRSHLQLQKKDEIDPGFWGVAIATLKPIRVRNDKVNVAIVLHEKDGIEEGLYVSIPISSYAPRVGDRFTLLDQLTTGGGRPIGQLYHYKLKQNAK